MKLDFLQMHTTPGLDFDPALNYKVLTLLIDKIQDLEIEIPQLIKKYENSDYALHVYIIAISEDDFSVKGPTYLRKRNVVEFFARIPFKKNADFNQLLEYILCEIKRAIIAILEKYKAINNTIVTNLDQCFSGAYSELISNRGKYF